MRRFDLITQKVYGAFSLRMMSNTRAPYDNEGLHEHTSLERSTVDAFMPGGAGVPPTQQGRGLPFSPFGNTTQPMQGFPATSQGFPVIPKAPSPSLSPQALFGGMLPFGVPPTAMPQQAAQAASGSDGGLSPSEGGISAPAPMEDSMKELRYTCLQCSKTFRLESAFIHHMQIKHQQHVLPGQVQPASVDKATLQEAMAQPQVAPSPFTMGGGIGEQGGASSREPKKLTQEELARMEIMHKMKEAAAERLPLSEINIGSHGLCVSKAVLVGSCSEIQRGYFHEDYVTQFVVACPFENCPPGETEKDNILVRCSGLDTVLKGAMKENDIVCVVGQLRMNPQMDPTNSKFYYFPSVYVTPSTGSVTVLS